MWDNLLGLHWLPLTSIKTSSNSLNESNDICVSLDSELCLREGQIIGTQGSTGHKFLINARIDLSASDLNEQETKEMQKKLELLNEILEQEVSLLNSSKV